MKRQSLYILTLSVVALAGCQNNDIAGLQDLNDGTVRYAVSFGDALQTRAAVLDAETPLALSDKEGKLVIPMELEVSEGISLESDTVLTRGTQVNTGGDDSALGSFSDVVSGFTVKAYNGDGVEKLSQSVSWSGTAWTATPVAYWPQATILNFLAYANMPLDQSATIASTGVSTEHTVPATASQQKDILFGYYQGNGGNTGTAEIRFNHPLTAVRFKYGEMDENPTIKRISLSGVAPSGTATMIQDGSIAWSEIDSHNGIVSQENLSGLPVNATTSVIGEPFLIIPQNVATLNVKVMVTFTDDTVLEGILNTGVWKAGYTNTYTIGYKDEWEYIIEGLTPISVEYNGRNSIETGYLKSYRQKASDPTVKEVVPWSFEYSSDNVNWSSTKPAWLNFNKISGNGSLTGEKILTSVSAQTYVESTKSAAAAHKSNLQATQPKGTSSSRFDLSYYNVATGQNISGLGRCTANMYVVNASGYYKFPIVYGNALKFDQFNEDAVIADPLPTGANPANYRYLTHFVNHDDMPITSPWIKDGKYKNGSTIGTSGLNAVVIWQDSQDLVTNVGIDGDYITFDVANTSIAQGNCVIAVRNSSNVILWSWQIWVTDEELTQTENFSYHGQQYHFMKVNLGWYSAGTLPCKSYIQRECYVRANNGHTTYSFKITQKAHEDVDLGTRGSCTYYQWGRKDPVPGGDGTTTAKTRTLQYPSGSQYTFQFVYGSDLGNHEYVSIGKSIQRPYYMNHAWNDMGGFYIDWNDKHYHNLWSTNLQVPNGESSFNQYKSIPTVKTIYDPSPVGFKVPEANAFENFTSDNTSWNNDVKGWEYKVNGITTVFFPAVGCLSSGVMQQNTHWYVLYSGFNIWSSSPSGDVSTAYDFSADITNWPMINHSYFNKGNAQALHVITDIL